MSGVTGFAPWTARGSEVRDVDREFLVRVILMRPQGDAPAVEARLARRISAALNACAEIQTEGLELVAQEDRTLALALEASLLHARPSPEMAAEIVSNVRELFGEQDARAAGKLLHIESRHRIRRVPTAAQAGDESA